MNIVLLDDEDEMLSAIRTQQPDYAWYGGLGLSDDGTWTDVMRGVVATSGARPSVGTLNGRRAAMFANQYLLTPPFTTIEQPFCVVAAIAPAIVSDTRFLFDGPPGSTRLLAAIYQISGNVILMAAGANLSSAGGSVSTGAQIWTLTYNGASSAIAVNGTAIQAGNAGTNGLARLYIGSDNAGARTFPGPIASLIVISGTNYAARAAAIANAARRWYRTG